MVKDNNCVYGNEMEQKHTECTNDPKTPPVQVMVNQLVYDIGDLVQAVKDGKRMDCAGAIMERCKIERFYAMIMVTDIMMNQLHGKYCFGTN